MKNYVICCDNFYARNKNNLVKILDNNDFEILPRHDITFPTYLEVDEIFNFACPASPVHYQNDPVQTVKTCVHGAINMLGLGEKNRLKNNAGINL